MLFLLVHTFLQPPLSTTPVPPSQSDPAPTSRSEASPAEQIPTIQPETLPTDPVEQTQPDQPPGPPPSDPIPPSHPEVLDKTIEDIPLGDFEVYLHAPDISNDMGDPIPPPEISDDALADESNTKVLNSSSSFSELPLN